MALLMSEDMNFMTNVVYQSVVGSLVYTMICTQAVVVYVVGVVSQYMTNLRSLHWSAVKWIFRYLKGTMDQGLSCSESPNLLVVGYCERH